MHIQIHMYIYVFIYKYKQMHCARLSALLNTFSSAQRSSYGLFSSPLLPGPEATTARESVARRESSAASEAREGSQLRRHAV